MAVSGRLAEEDQRSWDHTVPCNLQATVLLLIELQKEELSSDLVDRETCKGL